uniref:Uncharacterized protein n=1 Tax=Aplanochytrium stocchinoi TaxID=215587 RepID=A0A7S3LGC4_9STRA
MRQFLYIFLQLHNFIIRLFVVFVQLVTTPVHTIFQLLQFGIHGFDTVSKFRSLFIDPNKNSLESILCERAQIVSLLKSARPGDKLGFPCFMTQRNIKIDM